MNTFQTINEAEKAAQQFFAENFNYTSGVGIEKKEGNTVTFYSKDDPAMDDTFTCIVLGNTDALQKAAAHFMELYSDEIKAGEVTDETIYEWWKQTQEQYEGVDYEMLETLILDKI